MAILYELYDAVWRVVGDMSRAYTFKKVRDGSILPLQLGHVRSPKTGLHIVLNSACVDLVPWIRWSMAKSHTLHQTGAILGSDTCFSEW